jgi:hypothetical protein
MASDTPSRAPKTQPQADSAPSQDALWAALSASSSRARPEARLLPSFPSGTAELVNDERANARDLLCPRPGCGSVILCAGDAVLESAPSMQVRAHTRIRGRSLIDRASQLEPEGAAHALLTPMPAFPTPVDWWHVAGGPMAFENVAFSRPTALPGARAGDAPTPTSKLLACAECELGPLGWGDGREFWVFAGRVGYRA